MEGRLNVVMLPLQEVADAYLRLLRSVLLETPSVTTADVTALLKFHDENHIDFEVCGARLL